MAHLSTEAIIEGFFFSNGCQMVAIFQSEKVGMSQLPTFLESGPL